MKYMFIILTTCFSILAFPDPVVSPRHVVDEYPVSKDLTEAETKQVNCLAKNIYFEAGNQSKLGQKAVGLVTLNRVKSSRFPNSICKVVKEARYSKWHKTRTGKLVPLRNKCQFSWYCDGKSDNITNRRVFAKIYNIAKKLYLNQDTVYDITKGALWYHADYVSPYWKKAVTKTVKIGQHIFYKDNKHDAKTKLSSNRRAEVRSFVLLADGRYKS